MLGPHPKADESRRDALQPWQRVDHPHHERSPERPIAGLQRQTDEPVLDHDLHGLRDANRKRPPPPHRIEFVFGGTALSSFSAGARQVNSTSTDLVAMGDAARARPTTKKPRRMPGLLSLGVRRNQYLATTGPELNR
jgi:hypothetical protein